MAGPYRYPFNSTNSLLYRSSPPIRSNAAMASQAGSRIRNIIKRILTGAINNPNTNEQIKLSIAIEVRTEDSHWVRPEEIAKGQADALWKVIDHNKDQLKPGTVEISQR